MTVEQHLARDESSTTTCAPRAVLVVDGADEASVALPSAPRLALEAIDTMARLGLAARRRGGKVRLEHVSAHLAGMLELTGLRELFSEAPGPASTNGGRP